jgi:hypothetical protein
MVQAFRIPKSKVRFADIRLPPEVSDDDAGFDLASTPHLMVGLMKSADQVVS